MYNSVNMCFFHKYFQCSYSVKLYSLVVCFYECKRSARLSASSQILLLKMIDVTIRPLLTFYFVTFLSFETQSRLCTLELTLIFKNLNTILIVILTSQFMDLYCNTY